MNFCPCPVCGIHRMQKSSNLIDEAEAWNLKSTGSGAGNCAFSSWCVLWAETPCVTCSWCISNPTSVTPWWLHEWEVSYSLSFISSYSASSICVNFVGRVFVQGFNMIESFRHSTSYASSTTTGSFPPNALIRAVLSNFQVIWCWIEGDGGLLAWRAVARVFAIVAILSRRWCSTYGLWHSSRGRCGSFGSS